MDKEIKMLLTRLLTLDRGIVRDMEVKGFAPEDTEPVRDEIRRLIIILGKT